MIKKLLLIPLILSMTACSTAYQKRGYFGGYDEMKLSSSSYLVEYTSNEYTNSTTNAKHVLRRAAELTKQNGFKYFKVESINDTTSQYTTPIVATTTNNANSQNGGAHSSFGQHGYYNSSGNAHSSSSTTVSGGKTITRPGVVIVITMLESTTKNGYDADIILANFNK